MDTPRGTLDLRELGYVRDELLLTINSAAELLQADSPVVADLLATARAIAAGNGPGEADPSHDTVQQCIARAKEHWPTPQPMLTLRLPLEPGGKPSRRDNVRAAVDRVNGHIIAGTSEALQRGNVAVTSVMPNWIIGGALPHMVGGPATDPIPAPSNGDWRFKVPGPLEAPDPATIDPNDRVIVVVLDTWPGQQSIDDAAGGPQGNWLMKEFATPSAIAIEALAAPHDATTSIPVMTHACDDHGLFVAGIIRSIAPHVELRVFDVLYDRGVGDAHTLLRALDRCIHLAQQGHRLVVNLSLFLWIPPDDAPRTLHDAWFAHGPDLQQAFHEAMETLQEELGEIVGAILQRLSVTQDEPTRTHTVMARLVDPLTAAIEMRINRLVELGAVVVASAGNDAFAYGSLRRPRHVQPRLPADMDTVVCVVATDKEGRIASYSNRADIPMTGNGVATLGGQTRIEERLDPTTQRDSPAPEPDPRDGIVGIFSRPDIVNPNDNAYGWATWTGTSFAAPIVSALAANVLAKNEHARTVDPTVRRLAPSDVLRAILAEAVPHPDPALGCPYVPVTQTK